MTLTEKQIFRHLPQLTGHKVLLRKITMDDAQDVFRYAKDPEVSRYVLWEPHTSLADATAFVKSVVRKYDLGEVAEWGIVDRASTQLIGTCGFVGMQLEHLKAEIGYALARPYWNKGYMTEALQLVLRHAFHDLKLNRLEARCVRENQVSQHLLRRAGMHNEGTAAQSLWVKGQFVDIVQFGMLRTDWLARQDMN